MSDRPDTPTITTDGPPEEGPGALDRDRREDGRPENARPRDRFGAPLPRDAADEMPDRVEPEDVCDTVDEAREAAIALFDQQRFFEAHEFFEWAWKGPVTPDDERGLYKGLAQIAVGLTHTQRGNAPGARTLLERGVIGIEPHLPAAHGMRLDALTAEAQRMLTWLGDHVPTPDAPFPTFPVSDD